MQIFIFRKDFNMSKSALYLANSNAQPYVVTGTTVNFGSVVRKYGCNAYVSGGNPVVDGIGYYAITANLNFTGTSSGNVTVQLYKDGVAIPGAVGIVTVASGIAESVTIPAIIRQHCCCESTITAVISGTTGSVDNAAIEVIKL